jgi:Xaa-Pro dipeptidase
VASLQIIAVSKESKEGAVVIPQDLSFGEGEIERRLDAIRLRMAERGVTGLILFSPGNVHYVSGLDTEMMYGTGAVVMPLAGEPVLVVSEFERGRADNTCWLRSVVTFQSGQSLIDGVLEAARTLDTVRGHIAVEQRSQAPLPPPIGPAGLEQLRSSLPGATFHDAWAIVEEVRLRKSAPEVEYMRRAARFTEIGVTAGFKALHEGVRDFEVASAITSAIYGAGSELMCWGPIVASGYRAGAPHSTFGGRRIERGDTILLELTGQVRRYVAPALRTAIVGRPPPKLEAISAAAHEAVAAVLSVAGPGVAASDVARAGQAALGQVVDGLVFHGTFGYPVGLGFPPGWGENRGYLIRPENHRLLEPGMTFHLAISLRRFGEFGVCHSQTMLVTDTGAEALTFPASLYIVD